MKRIATGLLLAAGYANAYSFEEINGLRGNVVTASATPMADPTVKHCSDAHCTEIGAVLTDTCKKNSWAEGHVVMLYNLKEKETCYCNCPASFSFENTRRIGSFLPKEQAESLAKNKAAFRPKSDEDSKRWAQDVLDHHKIFFPDVQLHLDWENDDVNAYAEIRNGVRHVTILGGLVRHESQRPEGIALVLAHELGHHFGGEPYYPDGQKMSCEGQADWAGVRDLMRKVWWGEHYVDITRKAIPQMAKLFGAPDSPKIPDTGRSNCNHPPGPCRIGTYYAALSLEHEKPQCSI